MILSLPIIVIIAAELAAHSVATRPAVPIGCHNSDSRVDQRLNLSRFSRSTPDPCALTCQNDASHRLRCRHQSALVSTHGNFPHSAK
jgi:hypothetical protein